MNRRTLLALAGSVALGGCLSNVPGVGPPVDVGCPSFADGVDSLCSHTADPKLELRPASWRLPRGKNVSLTFELTNRADRSARFAVVPALKRRDGEEWTHVWPIFDYKPERELEPGGSYSWEFLFGGDATTTEADEQVVLYGKERGTYAMVLNAALGDRTVQCVAPFVVEQSAGTPTGTSEQKTSRSG